MKQFLNMPFTDNVKDNSLKRYKNKKGFHLGRAQIAFAATLLLTSLFASSVDADLVHPGGWHSQDDLTTIREKVAAREEPWITGWNAAKNDGPDANYRVSEGPLVTNNGAMHRSGMAAWILTMKWVASGDRDYSDGAIRIINHWVNNVTDFDVYGPTLILSTGAGAMAQAAEILEHGFNGEAGWPQWQADAAKTWFKTVIYDPWTNTGLQSSSNWGTSALGGNMSMAIFMDDENAYEYQREAFKYGYQNTDDGCNSLTDYIVFPTGQALETGRDQAHVQGGIAHLTEAALIMWHQGEDLVYRENNRLLAGVEYHARYNLGYNDLPYNTNIPAICGDARRSNDPEISEDYRGEFSPVYWMSAKLFSKAGLPHPNTLEVLEAPGYSPEINNFAHPGLGMFTFVPTSNDNRPNDNRPDDNNENPISGTNASLNGNDARFAVDGNPRTRWTTKTVQRAGQVFQLDLGSRQTIGKIILDSERSPNDEPERYSLSVSDDGNNYDTVATGRGSSDGITEINFTERSARFVRITQTGSKIRNWWSIHEISVSGSSNDNGGEEEQTDNGNGDALDRRDWRLSASSSGEDINNAIDNSTSSRWTTRQTQRDGQWLEIDLSESVSFRRIVLDSEASSNDYPRNYTLSVSNDGFNWTNIESGTGSATTNMTFARQTARYIRIEQTGSDNRFWWSIHDINISQ